MTADALRDARPDEVEGVPRKGRPQRRPKTMSRREMLREKRRREKAGNKLEILEYDRPTNRSQCVNGARPCLYVACKYHLYLDVNPETGSIKINFPDQEPWELEDSCSLDIAERGGVTLEEVGEILNLTRERVRQVEVTGLGKLRQDSAKQDLDSFIGWDPSADSY
jgi:hypothetical protein